MLAEAPTSFGSDLATARNLSLSHFTERASNLRENFIMAAFHGEKLIGSCGAYRETDPKRRHIAQIWGMYVSPQHRSEGLAGALLTRALERLKGLEGLELVQLAVTAGNEPAERLYERMGFECYGREPQALRVDGVDYDELLMARALS